MSQFINELSDILIIGLNENEQLEFIKHIINNLSSENESKLKRFPTSTVLIYTLNILNERGILSKDDPSLIIQTLKKMKKESLVIKLEASHSKFVEINGISIGLNFEPYKFQLKLAQKGTPFQIIDIDIP